MNKNEIDQKISSIDEENSDEMYPAHPRLLSVVPIDLQKILAEIEEEERSRK